MKIEDNWVAVAPPESRKREGRAIELELDDKVEAKLGDGRGSEIRAAAGVAAGVFLATASVMAVAYYISQMETEFLWRSIAEAARK
ncbi:MAG TPA: hypothetical protein VGD60_06825 [Candidatus Acidoferrales bacterium]